MKNKNTNIRIIQTPINPNKYINNYSKKNNSAFDLNPDNINPNESLFPKSHYNSNNIKVDFYQIQTYQKKNNISEKHDDDLNSEIFYLHSNKNKNYSHRNKKKISENNIFPSNYSYYESKYSKKVSKPQNYEVNTTYHVHKNNQNLEFYSNEKIGKYNNQTNNSLSQNLNKSHILSPKSFSKIDDNMISPAKKTTEMFYSKIIKNKINYFEKQNMINPKNNPNIIKYGNSYNLNTNIPEKIIQPKTPSLYSQFKIYNNNNNNNIQGQNYLLTNYSIKNSNDKNLHNLNSKSLESIAFSNKLIDFHDLNMNNRKMNYVQNNFKKVVKYTNQKNNNNSISIISDKDNVVHPFRLSGVNKHIMNNNDKTSTIVNITYINENTNYIKNVYSNDILKPQSRDKFILDNEKKIEHLPNDKGKTPNEGIKIIKQSKPKINTPVVNKIRKITNMIKDTKVNNQIHEIKHLNKNENDYMKEIKNIMYNKNTNSKPNENYIVKSSKILLPKDIDFQKDNHNLMSDVDTAQKAKEENQTNISLNIKKLEEKIDNRDYQLNYKAKITESKYRKKSGENIIISKYSNNLNNDTINTNKSYYPKTASKYNGGKITKSFINSLNKISIQNNKLAVSSQLKSSNNKNSNNNKDTKKISTPLNISRLTITNTSSKKQKTKTIKIKKVEKQNNNNNKINPFKYEEKEKDNRKKTLDIIKSNIKREKEKEKKIYIKKIESLSIAGRNEQKITKINQDTFFIEKKVNGVENFNIFGVLDGHGENGHFASKFVKSYIINQIKSHPLIKNEKDPQKIYSKIISDGYQMLANIYLDADVKIQHQGFDCSRSGTTCIIIIQLLEHIICANTGDSRAIIVFDQDSNLFKSKIYPLSYDCKPELPNEKKRIEESGGVVEKAYYSDDEDGEFSGPWRVWAKGEDFPGLAMSRSIGDFDAKKVGVIPNPQIVEYKIDKASKYFVMASDGIWEFISNEECMKIANQFYLRDDCLGMCRELSKLATELWDINDIIRDDITIIVGFF